MKRITTKEYIDDKLSRTFPLYVRWKARPIESDDLPADYPKSNQEFALKHGLALSDIAVFDARPDFQTELAKELVLWARARLPELFHSGYKHAKTTKNLKDAEAFVSLIKGLEGQISDSQSPGSMDYQHDIDDDQYNEIIQREARSLEARGATPAA